MSLELGMVGSCFCIHRFNLLWRSNVVGTREIARQCKVDHKTGFNLLWRSNVVGTMKFRKA